MLKNRAIVTHHSELSSKTSHWLGDQREVTAKQTRRHLHLLAIRLVTSPVDGRALDVSEDSDKLDYQDSSFK